MVLYGLALFWYEGKKYHPYTTIYLDTLPSFIPGKLKNNPACVLFCKFGQFDE